MKYAFFLSLLFFCNLCSFSQGIGADTLKELNELKTFRLQLLERSSKLEAQIRDEQILIDSCLEVLQDMEARAAELRKRALKKDKKTIEEIDKAIADEKRNIADISKQQSEDREQLEKATQLLADLDSRIRTLSGTPG